MYIIVTFCGIILYPLLITFLYRLLYKPNKLLTNQNAFYYLVVGVFISVYANLMLSIRTNYGDSEGIAAYVNQLINHPFSEYLTQSRIMYPPLFCYVYYIIGKLLTLLQVPITTTSQGFLFAMKTPCFLVEYGMAYLFYQFTKKEYDDCHGLLIFLVIVFHPAYLLLTAYISQVDALYSFLIVLTLYFIYERKLQLSYFSFAAAILFKFQAIFITPVILLATLNDVILHDFTWKNFWKHLISGICAIICMALSYVPFLYDFRKGSFIDYKLTDNFSNSIASFGLATQNTTNFWYLLGYNFKSESEKLGPLTCTTWYKLFIVLLVILCCYLFWINRENRSSYPLLAALLVSGTICFAVRMMPRYLYPAAGLTTLALIVRWTHRRFICMLSMNLALFLINSSDYLLYPLSKYSTDLIIPRLFSVYMLGCFGYVVYVLVTEGIEKSCSAA